MHLAQGVLAVVTCRELDVFATPHRRTFLLGVLLASFARGWLFFCRHLSTDLVGVVHIIVVSVAVAEVI
jgi:hypothetical protein